MTSAIRQEQTAVTQEQPAIAAGDPLRPVRIRARLLPAEVVDARRGRRARRWVLTGLVLLLAVLGGWYTLTVLQTAAAHTELARAEDEAAQLTRQQRQYSELLDTQRQSKVIDEQLRQLFADDVRWPSVLSSLRDAAPAGVRLTSVTAASEPVSDDPAAKADTRLPSTVDAETVGTIDLGGVAGSKPQLAAYVDALAGADGIADPYLDSAVEDDDGFIFSIRLNITADALGGRHSDTGGN